MANTPPGDFGIMPRVLSYALMRVKCDDTRDARAIHVGSRQPPFLSWALRFQPSPGGDADRKQRILERPDIDSIMAACNFFAEYQIKANLH
jgi:hypothetical protein